MRISALVLAFTSVCLAVTASMAASVVVKPGDTLSSIAKRELGSGKFWWDLCQLNKAVLPDCENLPVGVTISTGPDAGATVAEPVAPEAEDKPAEPAAEPAPRRQRLLRRLLNASMCRPQLNLLCPPRLGQI